MDEENAVPATACLPVACIFCPVKGLGAGARKRKDGLTTPKELNPAQLYRVLSWKIKGRLGNPHIPKPYMVMHTEAQAKCLQPRL